MIDNSRAESIEESWNEKETNSISSNKIIIDIIFLSDCKCETYSVASFKTSCSLVCWNELVFRISVL